MAANQREEGRKKRATSRPRATRHQARELIYLDREKAETEGAGDGHAELKPELVALVRRNGCKTAAKARGKKQDGFDRNISQFEQFTSARPASRLSEQNGVAREQGREHHHVAEDENQEAVAAPDSLGSRAILSRASFLHPAEVMGVAMWMRDR